MSEPAPAVVVDGLRVIRGGRLVLHEIDCTIAAGAITGLVGPSGCGKTTLLRAIVGLQKVAGGAVRVLGLPAGAAPLRHRVGYMTQAPSVYGDLTVDENLRYFAAVLGVRDRVSAAVATVGLEGYETTPVRELSGGERSRVSLAVTLLGAPDVLVLDEPTVGVDPVLRRELWSTFRRLAAEGTSLVVSTHVMDEADRCDRLLLMREGRILAEGAPTELRDRTGSSSLEEAFLVLAGAA